MLNWANAKINLSWILRLCTQLSYLMAVTIPSEVSRWAGLNNRIPYISEKMTLLKGTQQKLWFSWNGYWNIADNLVGQLTRNAIGQLSKVYGRPVTETAITRSNSRSLSYMGVGARIDNFCYFHKGRPPSKKKNHCQRHNGPEGWVHITSSTQILIKLQFRNLD